MFALSGGKQPGDFVFFLIIHFFATVRFLKNPTQNQADPVAIWAHWGTVRKKGRKKKNHTDVCCMRNKRNIPAGKLKSRKMHGHRVQLLQKHHVLLVNVRSAKFCHNKSRGVFPSTFLSSVSSFLNSYSWWRTEKRGQQEKPNDKMNWSVDVQG